ncbi:MAG: hypothetical protein FWC56_02085 [Phycisphaerae bacterium]|nr:hypothetical protein [Phycisphaerae bacterium]
MASKKFRKGIICGVGLCACFCFSSLAFGASIQGLGFGTFPGDDPYPGAVRVSGDGSTVIGTVYWFDNPSVIPSQGFRWTQTDGFQWMGYLPSYGVPSSGLPFGELRTVNYDGSVIIGSDREGYYRWTATGGKEMLYIEPTGVSAWVLAFSGDGSTAIGISNIVEHGRTSEPFRWTQADGIQRLMDTSWGMDSEPLVVNYDGSVIAGIYPHTVDWGVDGASPQVTWGIFRWTSENGTERFGPLPDGVTPNLAAISADGSTIIGRIYGQDYYSDAFCWTPDDGIQLLGDKPDWALSSSASWVSADGSTIFGYWDDGESFVRSFIWDQEHGARDLLDVLKQDYHLDWTGWEQLRVLDISADGNTFVGLGINPAGQQEFWMATISEPSTISLLALASLGLLRRKGRAR